MARFKKGSAAAKAWGAKMKRLRNKAAPTSSSIKRKRSKKMAKKRKSKTYRRSVSTGLKPAQVLIGGGIYGALREKASNALTPLTSKIPFGNIADEAVLFGIGYFANKKMKDKTIKSVAQAAMFIEAARIGEAIADGSAFGTSSNGAGSNFQATTF